MKRAIHHRMEIEANECIYHTIFEKVNLNIMFKIVERFEWQGFWYWLGDESDFAGSYRDAFNEVLPNLTEEQLTMIESKGRNLENTIHKWRTANLHITSRCLQYKVFDYLAYQFKKNDIKSIIGTPC